MGCCTGGFRSKDKVPELPRLVRQIAKLRNTYSRLFLLGRRRNLMLSGLMVEIDMVSVKKERWCEVEKYFPGPRETKHREAAVNAAVVFQPLSPLEVANRSKYDDNCGICLEPLQSNDPEEPLFHQDHQITMRSHLLYTLHCNLDVRRVHLSIAVQGLRRAWRGFLSSGISRHNGVVIYMAGTRYGNVTILLSILGQFNRSLDSSITMRELKSGRNGQIIGLVGKRQSDFQSTLMKDHDHHIS